ncbi:protein precursor [Cordyceps militaris CM01]|uniref:Protein n=2 Tax=Cordyceps militaris TaxID=73501 RepID=G3JH72_CORMM|nr:protein precursor [Cordyceps militaris CM01]ATY58722.1 protein precursor [Cordyceps militaris]EGX91628.1 protein precursor [Cordyceps militaris CM01]
MFILFSISLFFIVTATALFFTRSYWLRYLPDVSTHLPSADYLYSRLPSTFAGDIEAGLSSSTFDLSGNVDAGDSRAGLDDTSKAEVLKIMKKRRLNFDKARKVYMESRFKANGIGPDGLPRDPKFVSFS